MIIKTRGIVFRCIKYGESSVIVDIYTEEKGLQTYIVNSVRTAKAKVHASLVQVMSLVEMVVYHRDDKAMHHVKEIKSAYTYQSLPFQVKKGTIGLFMAELVQKTVKEAEPNPELFIFLADTFVFLDQTEHPIANVHLHFMLQLASHLGFEPNLLKSEEKRFFNLKEGVFMSQQLQYSVNEEHSQLLYELGIADLENCHKILMNVQQRRAVLNHLLTYYQLHIEHFPVLNTYTVLQDVL
jgi:DNA repair protein RecO (recombination protein O)